jgi:hypothetical protein
MVLDRRVISPVTSMEALCRYHRMFLLDWTAHQRYGLEWTEGDKKWAHD